MRIELFILISMIFCHILDDYYLQGILAQLKQKQWWKEHIDNKKYDKDYIMALFCHSFSWSFSIQIPFLILSFYVKVFSLNVILFVINLIVHMYIDDLKCNKFKINLIQDQLLHFLQIFITWFIIIYL